ncbi:MAG: maltooligosyltrehalose trehalohydrolase, partial [Actinomycetota bacterium]|nr:maltooligosyltrehalose trehalohydrolase [Actinomycetota bacterium]
MRPAVWAPQASQVRAVIGTDHSQTEELLPDEARPGWWRLDTDLVPGTRYGYLLDDD